MCIPEIIGSSEPWDNRVTIEYVWYWCVNKCKINIYIYIYYVYIYVYIMYIYIYMYTICIQYVYVRTYIPTYLPTYIRSTDTPPVTHPWSNLQAELDFWRGHQSHQISVAQVPLEKALSFPMCARGRPMLPRIPRKSGNKSPKSALEKMYFSNRVFLESCNISWENSKPL